MRIACPLSAGADCAGRGGRAGAARCRLRPEEVHLRLRPAAHDRLRHRRRHLRRQAQGAERRQAEHRPVPRRAARPGAGDAAEDALGRHRLRHHVDGQCRRRWRRRPACSRCTSSSATRSISPRRSPIRRSSKAFRDMVKDSVQGAQVLGLMTMGMRNMYSQEGDQEGRRHQGHEDPRAGDQDRGHALPGLRHADRAHAVRRGLHLAADRRRERGRERRQRLPRQQALRGGADPVDHRARGQQQLHLGQRQDLEQPQRPGEAVGAGGGRRGRPRQSRRMALKLEADSAEQAEEASASRSSKTSTSPAS